MMMKIFFLQKFAKISLIKIILNWISLIVISGLSSTRFRRQMETFLFPTFSHCHKHAAVKYRVTTLRFLHSTSSLKTPISQFLLNNFFFFQLDLSSTDSDTQCLINAPTSNDQSRRRDLFLSVKKLLGINKRQRRSSNFSAAHFTPHHRQMWMLLAPHRCLRRFFDSDV